tara:strand:- start:429 stop:785 length:357 start_codon:yes stop_codon:yes gene_type:complete
MTTKKELMTTLGVSRTINTGHYSSAHFSIQKEYAGKLNLETEYRNLYAVIDSEIGKRFTEPPVNISEKNTGESGMNVSLGVTPGKKPCNKCGGQIGWIGSKELGWKPVNLNGSKHICN